MQMDGVVIIVLTNNFDNVLPTMTKPSSLLKNMICYGSPSLLCSFTMAPITNNDESLRTRPLVLILNFKGLYCNRMKICFCALIDLVLNVWIGQVAIVTCAIEEVQW